MSWAKKIPPGSSRNDFRDSGQGAVPPQMASLRKENLMEGGPNLSIKVGQTGLSKAIRNPERQTVVRLGSPKAV
jgi:hypothetical protein